MSSHREAAEISKDPVADGTDTYAFRSPDRPDTVTLVANFIPLQKPDGGPNFYEFGDDVRYEIHIDNAGPGSACRMSRSSTARWREAACRRWCSPISGPVGTGWPRRVHRTRDSSSTYGARK